MTSDDCTLSAERYPESTRSISRAAVSFRQCRPQHTELAHLGHDGAIERLGAIRFEYPGHQLALRILSGAVANHALLFRELILEQERIGPDERRSIAHRAVISSVIRGVPARN
jgi:hypothetical protein